MAVLVIVAFLVLAALVVSHWVLDFVTHRPDMPLYPGGSRLGLGLWNSVAATASIEVGMFAVGLWVYAASTRPRDRVGTWAFVSLALFLLVSYAVNLQGMPPSSVPALVATATLGTLLLLGWTWWADRHRNPIGVAAARPPVRGEET